MKTEWLSSPVDKGHLPLIFRDGRLRTERQSEVRERGERNSGKEELFCLLPETVHHFWFHLDNVFDLRDDCSKQLISFSVIYFINLRCILQIPKA